MCFVCDFHAIWGFHINNECPNCECIERIAGAGLKQYAGRIRPPGRILPMYVLEQYLSACGYHVFSAKRKHSKH